MWTWMGKPILGGKSHRPELENKKRRLRIVLALRGRRFRFFLECDAHRLMHSARFEISQTRLRDD